MANYTRKVSIPGKSADELYQTLNQGLQDLLTKAQLGKFEMQKDPKKKEMSVKGSLFSANLVCRDSEMDLNVKLSLLATPFKSKLDETITRWIEKTFPTVV